MVTSGLGPNSKSIGRKNKLEVGYMTILQNLLLMNKKGDFSRHGKLLGQYFVKVKVLSMLILMMEINRNKVRDLFILYLLSISQGQCQERDGVM